MELTLYHIDAFTAELFRGNPAAVCPLDDWLPADLLQNIAFENNLSETAFFVPKDQGYHIRWFSPKAEVDLCGHATLASAFVIFEVLKDKDDIVEFYSKSGKLTVKRAIDGYVLDFPAQPPEPCKIPQEIISAFKTTPLECLKSKDYIVLYKNEQEIELADPNFEQLKLLGLRGVIITAISEQYDFVARCFFPNLGIQEDPVTGSAYTQLAPYWTTKLGKHKFNIKQISARSGELTCEIKGDRVLITGKAVKYLEGKINI